MQVRVLGQVDAIDMDGRSLALGGPTQRRLLAALALRRNEVVSVRHLVDVVWSDAEPPTRAEHNVRTYVHRLRSSLADGGDRLETVAAGYRLHLGDDEFDVACFERCADTAARLTATGDPIAALDAIDEALRLWRGDPVEEFAAEDWAQPVAAHLTELHLTVRAGHAEALLDAGRPTEATVVLEQLVASEPLREGTRGLLMRALYESGRAAEALRAFQQFRRSLIDEIGVEPSNELVELDRAIAQGSLPTSTGARSVGGYELSERIGEGAFAVVHRANQRSLGREVAVKIVRAELANRPEFIRRFEAEAQMVAAIEHPNVVPLYDYWREPDRALLVMRWMSGGSLESRLDDGSCSLLETVDLVDQIAGALDAAHEGGIVHRDVKPGNILFDDAGRAYLGDFGIALSAEETSRPEAALSEGSPVFAAPEQLRREPAGPEADVHALGIVAFAMLAGRAPFADAPDERALLQHRLHDMIPPVSDLDPALPPAIDDVLAIATAKDPSDRYATASAFAAAFHSAATQDVPMGDAVRRRPRSNPYKGLRAFDETDAADFHGRERLVDELIAHLARPEARMLAVVGPSGSGKSSAVRAGLIPALRSGRVPGSSGWFTTTMTPGPRPFEALETALLRVAANPPAALLDQLRDGERGIVRAVRRIVPDDSGIVAIVIDQFEEVFTAGVDEADRALLLRALSVAVTEPSSPIRIVLTLRADFYDRPLRHPEFAPLLKQHTVVVTPLAPDELEHAIVTPAATVGVGFEPGLVAEIAADVNHEPGALPLLQYALTQAFDATDGDTITIDAYRSIGGLTGALGRRAEALYRSLGTDERRSSRRLFGRLVALGEGTEDTRRRVGLTELLQSKSTDAVLGAFGDNRLLTFDHDPASREPTVEIAHEALIREWPRLRRWLDEDRDALRVHRHLTETAAGWIDSGREDGELYRGGRLEAAATWASAHDSELNPTEQEFLDAGLAAHEAALAAERDRFDDQVRSNRRLRTLVAVAVVIALVAGGIGVFALQQRSRADDEAAEATQQAAVAQAAERRADLERLRAVATSTATERPELAALIAVEAYRSDPSLDSLDALHRVLTAVPGLREAIQLPGDGYTRVELVGNTTLVGAGSTVDVWDIAERRLVRSVDLPDIDRPPLLTVSADGSTAVVATTVDTLSVVDLEAGQVTSTFRTERPIEDLAIDPDGSAVAVGERDGTIGIWSVPDFDEVVKIETGAAVAMIRWSPSEAALAVVAGSSTVNFWDADTGEQRWSGPPSEELNVLNAASTGALFSPSGDVFVVDSGLLNPVVRSYWTADGSEAFPALARADGINGADGMFWRDADRRHVGVPTRQGIAFYDLANGVEVGERIDTLSVRDAVYSAGLGEIVAALSGHLVVRAADGAGPLERSIPLSDEQRTALEFGGTVHPAIAADGSRVLVSTLVGATISPTTAFDLTTPRPARADAPVDNRLVYGNGAHTMTFGLDPPGFSLLDGDDEVVGRYPLTFDMTDQDASADGRFVALAKVDGTIDLYAGGGELVHQFDIELPERAGGGLLIPSLSDDGRFLVVTAANPNDPGPNAVWSTDTFERIDDGTLAGQVRAVGNLLASRNRGVVRLFSLPDLQPIGQPMINESGGFFYPAIDADGERLAVTSHENVSVHDIETGEQLGNELPYRPIRIEYTADGTQLLVGSDDRVTVWNYDTDTWAGIACRVAGRNLTRDEWAQLGPRTVDYRATCEQYPIDE